MDCEGQVGHIKYMGGGEFVKLLNFSNLSRTEILKALSSLKVLVG